MSEAIAWALGVLACWRISHLLWAEEGPAGLMRRLREAAARTPLGSLFDCFYCLSLWVGAALAPVVLWLTMAPSSSTSALALTLAWALGAFALSGAAILIERLNPGTAPQDDQEKQP
jgi:Protein of unknown function (DUF1360)